MIPCRRKWQPTPVLLLRKSYWQRSLVSYTQSTGFQRVGHDQSHAHTRTHMPVCTCTHTHTHTQWPRCLTSLATRKIQIKILMKYHFIPTRICVCVWVCACACVGCSVMSDSLWPHRMARNKKSENRCCQGCGEIGSLVCCWGLKERV